jgi:two-component system CitB family response regulator
MKTIEVLIVEDDLRIAEIHRRFVEKIEGFQVMGIAVNESQAKEQVEILQPDLILLDIFFPDMSGLDFLHYVQQHCNHTDVIMITAAKEVEMVSEAIRGGVFDFIIKPAVFDRFVKTLQEYTSFHRQLQALQRDKSLITQQEIDNLLGRSVTGKTKASLPKGIDKLTLDKILLVIKEIEEGLTAEQVGKEVGVSRTTARRYLEYVVSQGEVMADLSYGMVGRPERIYVKTVKV